MFLISPKLKNVYMSQLLKTQTQKHNFLKQPQEQIHQIGV